MITTFLALSSTSNDPWGISAPTFAVLYLLIIIGVTVVALLGRRAVRRQRPTAAGSRPPLDPYQLAYLNGGPDLALLAGVGALRADGLVTARGRCFTRVENARGTGRHPLEQAILGELDGSVHWSTFRAAAATRSVLDGIRDELTRLGLLLSPEQRRRIRRMDVWFVAVLILGLFRLVSSNRPVLFLLVEMAAMVVLLVFWHRRIPLRSDAGDAALARQRTEHDHLSPGMHPSWATYGAGAAALSVALFGVTALAEADPAFAEEVAFRPATGSGGSWSGGVGGGCGSGGSSCGSSSGGGSSCGGGGGCGGGCGGGG